METNSNNGINVSVIMPVYNSGEYLKAAVESILNQSFGELELILVDDGSTDGSAERCDDYARKDGRVVVVHQKNGGICNARNAALRVARGKYVAFSDHDDEYLPGYLACAYKRAIETDADIVKVGKKEYIEHKGNVLRTKQSNLQDCIFTEREIRQKYFQLVDSGEMDCLWDTLFRRELLTEHGLWLDESYRYGGEDIDFIQRVLPHVKKLVTVHGIFYNHFIRTGVSTSSKFNPDKAEAKKMLMHTFCQTLKSLGIPIVSNQQEYTFLLLRQYIAPLCAFYADESNPMNAMERKRKLQEIRQESFYESFCDHQPFMPYMMKSVKYGILYYLWTHEQYGLIHCLYRKRNHYKYE